MAVTREDMADFLKSHGCEMEPWDTGTYQTIVFYNPKTGRQAYINPPVDDTPMSETAIYKICSILGIEPLECAKYCKPLMDKIENQFPQSRKKR
jgi:hypothetical protein